MTQDPLDKELQWIRSMHSFGCPRSMFLSSMFHHSRLKRLLKQQNSLWWDQDNLVFDIGIRWLSSIRGFLVLLPWWQCKAVPKSCCWWFWPRHLVAQQTTRHGNHGNRWRSTSCNGSIPLDMVTASISFTMKLPHGQKHMWLGAKLLEKNLRWQAGFSRARAVLRCRSVRVCFSWPQALITSVMEDRSIDKIRKWLLLEELLRSAKNMILVILVDIGDECSCNCWTSL